MGRSTPTHAPENQHLVELTVDEAKVMIIDLQEAVTEKDIVIHDLEDAKRDKDDEIAQLQNTIAQLLGPKPPDHHYGWVIVMCTFILQFTVLGGINSYGVFLDDDGILGDEDLGKPSKSKASVVVSVANGLTPVVGLFAGKLCDRWGPRPVLTMGGITLGLGLTAASYCKDFVMFTLSFGLILGISGGCTISPGIAAVGGWFDLRRPLAFGVAYAGSGLGTTLCPILASYLLEHNSWRNSFRYLAFMGIPAVIAGLIVDRRTPYVPPCPLTTNHLSLKQIVTNKIIIALFLVGMCFAYGFFFVVVYTYTYAQAFGNDDPYTHRDSISKSNSTLLLSIFGATQTFGNVIWGDLSRRFGNLRAFKIAHVVCGLVMIAWPFCQWYAALAAFSAVFGFFIAGCLTCYPALAAEHFAGPQLGMIIAIVYLGFGTGSLIGPPISGAIVNLAGGDYMIASFVAAGMYFVAVAITHFLIPPLEEEVEPSINGSVIGTPALLALAAPNIPPQSALKESMQTVRRFGNTTNNDEISDETKASSHSVDTERQNSEPIQQTSVISSNDRKGEKRRLISKDHVEYSG